MNPSSKGCWTMPTRRPASRPHTYLHGYRRRAWCSECRNGCGPCSRSPRLGIAKLSAKRANASNIFELLLSLPPERREAHVLAALEASDGLLSKKDPSPFTLLHSCQYRWSRQLAEAFLRALRREAASGAPHHQISASLKEWA